MSYRERQRVRYAAGRVKNAIEGNTVFLSETLAELICTLAESVELLADECETLEGALNSRTDPRLYSGSSR